MKDFVPKPSEYEFLVKIAQMTDPEEIKKARAEYEHQVDEYFAWMNAPDDEPGIL